MDNTSDTIQEWFEQNLLDYADDIANHGAYSGYPYITYTSDCIQLYEQYADQIWGLLIDESKAYGSTNVMEMIATFNRQDMFENYDSIRTILVWAIVETLARQYSPDS